VANTKSAQKAMRQAERRALRNRAARSSVRTYVKNATDAVATSSTDAADAADVVRAAVRALDKAAQKGIVHRNAAARRKSRLMSRLYRLSVAPPVTAETTQAKAPARRASAARGSARTGTRRTAGSGTRARRSS
jgi:small subunit ribosomal protein S20